MATSDRVTDLIKRIARVVEGELATDTQAALMSLLVIVWAEAGFHPSLGLIHKTIDNFAEYERKKAGA